VRLVRAEHGYEGAAELSRLVPCYYMLNTAGILQKVGLHMKVHQA
jgi:hypothetical protein